MDSCALGCNPKVNNDGKLKYRIYVALGFEIIPNFSRADTKIAIR